MDTVRLGLIGIGNMGLGHLKYLPKLEGVRLAAVADVVQERRDAAAREHGVPGFASGLEMIQRAEIDAVLIAMPHYEHVPLAVAALEKGLHVLCEKPLAVTALAAQEAIDCHRRHPELKFGVMFQSRMRPWWRKVKELVAQGRLGRLQRVTWMITSWFRSQRYYDSGGWRGTWAGEGGGVLLNQCPHNLDLLTWFVGTPDRVTARVTLGKWHRIEVEDDVHAIMEWDNGLTGHFVTTTGESPGLNRLEIAGTRGRLVCEDGPLIELTENEADTLEFSNTTDGFWSGPKHAVRRIETAKASEDHAGITRNFIAAILCNEPLVAPAAEGLLGLELGNAMLMSGLGNRTIAIPTPRVEYDALIRERARTSTFVKPSVRPARSASG